MPTAQQVRDAILRANSQREVNSNLASIGYNSQDSAQRAAYEHASVEWATRQATGQGPQTPNEPLDKKSNLTLFLRDLLKTQETGQQVSYSIKDQIAGVDDAFELFFDSTTGKLKQMKDVNVVGALIKKAGEGVNQYLSEQTYFLEEINRKTSLTGKLSKDYRDEISRAQPELTRLGITTMDLTEAAASLVENSGRFNLINRETFKEAGLAAKAYVGTLNDLVGMLPSLEAIGLGASDASKEITKAGKSSLELGLNAKGVIKDISTGVGKLNEYGFRNGVQGLARMVQLSKEFRIGLDEVFKVADKVYSPEGAVELAANMQVLGGAIGDLNDPFKMLYMATNDVEGLQKSLLGAAEGLATYNEEQGRFELTGVNLRLAKARADALGVSFQEFSKAAISSAERVGAKMELMSRGFTIEDDQIEFLTNISQMKDGKMQIELNDFLRGLPEFQGKTSVALNELTKEQKSALLQYQDEFKTISENDIVRNQATAVENIKRDVAFLAAELRLRGGKAVEAAATITGFDLKEVAKYTQDLSKKPGQFLDDLSKQINKEFKIDINAVERQKREDAINRSEEERKKRQEEIEAKRTGTTQQEQKVKIVVEYQGNTESRKHGEEFEVKAKDEYGNTKNK